ncbi:MAG: phosphodiester glycosidase family protein [Treponema sp.]|nr:phosphodiester glycosidase family protein [Treponema sp.]
MLFLFSCATLSFLELDDFVIFADVSAVTPEWYPLSAGVDYLHGRIEKTPLEFWALRVDLSAPGMQIVVKGGGGAGKNTMSAKVSSFVRDNDLIAGINAVPFDVSTAEEGRPIKNVGIVISGGELIAPANPNYDALVICGAEAAIVRQAEIKSIENIDNAVGGFHQILKAGEPASRTLNREDRHPRSAAGVSSDGKCLYLLVIDGRRRDSAGGTENETAVLLRSLGSWDGINLDGGGSSALALRYPDGKIRAVNNPVHGGIPGTERAVAGCLGINQ